MTEYRIELAESCGFCFGVRRAVEMVYDLRKHTDKQIYVMGELIHNGLFIERLKNDGIFCIEDESELEALYPRRKELIVVIRTHGVTKQLSESLAAQGFEVVDATCPFVKRIHKIVDENSRDGELTVIVGDKQHPEVVGIQSYAHGEAVVCADEFECLKILDEKRTNNEENIVLVSQTTGNNEKYVNCQKVIKKVYTTTRIFDTICSVTENRQNEVMQMAARADVMCVIGGAKSSNTRKLYEIARLSCQNVFLLEQARDVPAEELQHLCTNTSGRIFTVGITAGASTPDDIIEEVKVRIESVLKALSD